MSKRKDMPSDEARKSGSRINQQVDPANPTAASTLRQGLNLTRNEREKDMGLGKNVGEEQRKGKK